MCTADPGWVHRHVLTACRPPWTNGVTQVIYEGGFSARKWYQILEEYNVTVWLHRPPTAIRMLMKSGVELPKTFDLSNLRFAASVGEPLNPEAVEWGVEAIGMPFHDNWWQTETGGNHDRQLRLHGHPPRLHGQAAPRHQPRHHRR